MCSSIVLKNTTKDQWPYEDPYEINAKSIAHDGLPLTSHLGNQLYFTSVHFRDVLLETSADYFALGSSCSNSSRLPSLKGQENNIR